VKNFIELSEDLHHLIHCRDLQDQYLRIANFPKDKVVSKDCAEADEIISVPATLCIELRGMILPKFGSDAL
jgi:hypothetical protein